MENQELDRQSAGSMTAAGHVLTIEGLCRNFGAREIMPIARPGRSSAGDRVALCGPNGSGKTTVLRCIAGTLTPTSGRIGVGRQGRDARSAAPDWRLPLAGAVLLFAPFGAPDLLFFARVRGYGTREAARLVAGLGDELELESILGERVDRCSTGMVQQLAFARALLGEPPLLVLDEPTRSLDRNALARFWGGPS